MNIDQALNYFKQAEREGYYAPSAQELSTMTEGEIIGLAEDLGEKGDYLAQEADNV